MPAALYLLTISPDRERQVRDTLLSEPSVSACSTLFEGQLVVRVEGDDPKASMRRFGEIQGVREAAVYR